jgi:hypothetical protein
MLADRVGAYEGRGTGFPATETGTGRAATAPLIRPTTGNRVPTDGPHPACHLGRAAS